MSLLISLLVILIVLAIVYWLWTLIAPRIPEPIRTIILVIGVLIVIIFLLEKFGILSI
jgi:hypothetical protein